MNPETTMRPGPGPAPVLVVDDAAIVRAVCRRALTRAGFEVRAAGSGQDALIQLLQRPAQALLIDLRMPMLTGLECIWIFRDLWPRMEIVAMTAYGDDRMVSEVARAGVPLLAKPFPSLRELVDAVGRAVVRHRLKQQLPIDSETLLRLIMFETNLISHREFKAAAPTAGPGRAPFRQARSDLERFREREFQRALHQFIGEAGPQTTYQGPQTPLEGEGERT